MCKDKKIVFLDTPGHEAFTAMRAKKSPLTRIVPTRDLDLYEFIIGRILAQMRFLVNRICTKYFQNKPNYCVLFEDFANIALYFSFIENL